MGTEERAKVCWKAVVSRREFHVVQMVRCGINGDKRHSPEIKCRESVCNPKMLGLGGDQVLACFSAVAPTFGYLRIYLDCILVDGGWGVYLLL